MSKTYVFYCTKHGELTIVIEKPPMFSRKVFCPWCSNQMSEARRVEVKEQKLSLGSATA